MPRRRRAATAFSVAPAEAGSPAYRWLSSALRAQILEGRIHPGARLPSTRELARQYGYSRGTIVAAFEALRAEGYVAGSVGSGTYVNPVLPDELLHAPRAPRAAAAPMQKPVRALSGFARRVRPFPAGVVTPARAFRSNVPALDLFPVATWAQVAGRCFRRVTRRQLNDGDALGYLPLREALSEYLTTARGVRCTPAQVMVVAGVQEALDLSARVSLDRGDRVCLENPGYVGARHAFGASGAKIVALDVDTEGARLPQRTRDARLVYMTPAHQFPLGVSMSLTRRLAWLDWAHRGGALILEDDYDSEFRFVGRPLPALQGLDRHGVVLFTGSFGKMLFPSLRLGYLVLPPDLVDVFAAAKSVSSRHVPVPDQAVLCDFIRDGHFGRHVRRMRQIYAERRGVLLTDAQQYLRGLLEITGAEAGLQTAGWLQRGLNGEAVARAAGERDIEVIPLSRFGNGARREGLQLGFAAVETDAIHRGVRTLASILEELARDTQ